MVKFLVGYEIKHDLLFVNVPRGGLVIKMTSLIEARVNGMCVIFGGAMA